MDEKLKSQIEALKKQNSEAGLEEIKKILEERGLELKAIPEVIIDGKPINIVVISK